MRSGESCFIARLLLWLVSLQALARRYKRQIVRAVHDRSHHDRSRQEDARVQTSDIFGKPLCAQHGRIRTRRDVVAAVHAWKGGPTARLGALPRAGCHSWA